MKTTHYIYAAFCLSAIAAVSCSKEGNGDVPATKEECYIQGVAEQTTKTQISDLSAGTVSWNDGDAISVFSTDKTPHSNNKFTSSNISGSKASFSGEIESLTESFYAVYPYSEGMTYSDGVVSGATIPATQTATDNSFANGVSLSVASGTRTPGKPDCGTLNFENLCAVIAFTLPGNITFADQITVTSKSSTAMAGNVSIDCAGKTVSGASATSVTLNGTFTGGNTYMIAVAPGTYTNGFSFAITTKGKNSYSRETTKTIEAAAGKMYNLGALSLAMSQSDLSTSVAISHDVASNTLNGSTAKFTLTLNKSEYASAISKYKAVVTLKDASSNVYRTLTTEGTSIKDAAMSIANGKYYIPKGNYTYEASVTYTVNNGTKDVTRTLNYSGSVTSPQPSGFGITASVSGYTSYSTYKGTDGQTASAANANNLDGSTVYNFGATYSSGIADRVANQCPSLLTKSLKFDNVETAAGTLSGKSWASHTIYASISFDGCTKEASKTVYVTGLPFNKDKSNFYSTRSYWNINGTWHDNNYLTMYKQTCSFKNGFYVPSGNSINATLSYRFKIYSGGYAKNTYKINIGTGNPLVTETHSAFASLHEYSGTANATLTSSASTMSCVDACKAITQGSGYTQTFYIGVTYR